jgi:hypothetical protein
MNFIYIICIIFFSAVLLLGIITPALGQKKTTNNKISGMDSIKHFLSKEEIASRLISLAKSAPPTQLSLGAKCYKVALPPNRVEYICPKCGERTLYTDNQAYFLTRELPSCRALAGKISCVDLKLDESQFCRKCSNNVTKPRLGMVIRYKGDQIDYIKWGITDEDLNLIYEFCEGKNVHKGDYGQESPLKNYLKRIEELLRLKVNVE